MKVKIYGERNCGTNYLEKLLEANLNVTLLKFEINRWSLFLLKTIKYDFVQDFLHQLNRNKTLGWKHGCPPVKAIQSYKSEALVIITITKNPYSFLSSLYKNPYHIKGKKPTSLSHFIKNKWTTRPRDLCGVKHLKSPILLWNIKNKAYLELNSKVSKPVINITYEDLLKNPKECIQTIASKGQIEYLDNTTFKNHTVSTKNPELTYNNYKYYYLNEEWKGEFSKLDFDFLKTQIDDHLDNHFKYTLL